jgi:hypothetical protein
LGGLRRSIGEAIRSATIRPKMAASMERRVGCGGVMSDWVGEGDRPPASLYSRHHLPLSRGASISTRLAASRLSVVISPSSLRRVAGRARACRPSNGRNQLPVGFCSKRGDRPADLAGERVIPGGDLLGDLHPRAGLQLVPNLYVHGGDCTGDVRQTGEDEPRSHEANCLLPHVSSARAHNPILELRRTASCLRAFVLRG